MTAVKGVEIIYPGVAAVQINNNQIAHVSSPDAVSVSVLTVQNGEGGTEKCHETLWE